MSCDSLKILGLQSYDHITGTVEPKVVKFCISILATGYHITHKWTLLWSRDCFKFLPFAVMQLVARVCQRQLSYLCAFVVS